MKNIIPHKLFERSDPDNVSTRDVEGLDHTLQSDNEDALSFAREIETEKWIFGDDGDFSKGHGSTNALFPYESTEPNKDYGLWGRLWLDEKIIIFWNYPKQSQMKAFVSALSKRFNEKAWNNGWRIVLYKQEENGYYKLESLEEYSGSENAPEELRIIHMMNWQEKEQHYQKHGKPRGFGSDKTGWETDNNITWRQAKMRSEKMKTKFGEFINENNLYNDVFNHMRKLFNDGVDDDALLAERTADDLGLDIEENEDLLFDTAMEVVSGNF